MFQKIIILGNLGRDPELRYLPDGTAVCNISVAVSDYVKGEQKTTWFRVTLWKNAAENANQYLTKGRTVLVEGTLKSDERGNPVTFIRKDGTPGASFELNGHGIKFVGRGADAAPVNDALDAQGDTDGDDGLPF